jgi:hypothetical protein
MAKATALMIKVPDPKQDEASIATTKATRCLSISASPKKRKDRSRTQTVKRKKTNSSLSLPCSSQVDISSGRIVIDISSDSE